MKLIIEARFEYSDGLASPAIVVGEIQRQDRNLNDLGLTLAEGRDLLGQVQSRMVSQQVEHWLEQNSGYHRLGQALAHKDTRSVIVRTAFGKIAVPSPRWWSCRCGTDDAGEFVKAVQGSELARGRTLDWFHIAMKFKAAQNSVRGSNLFEPHKQDMVCDWLRRAKWHVWHGKGRQAVARIRPTGKIRAISATHP